MLESQKHIARIAALSVVSLGLAFSVGCHRDPNVRKQRYLESGKRYEADGKYKEASIQFQNAIRVDREFAPAWLELGKTDLKMGSLIPGIQALNTAVDKDPPHSTEARVLLGNIYLAAHRATQAEDEAKHILAINPNDADGYALLAGVADANGNSADALKQIQHALALDPNRANFHSLLALLEARNPDQEPNAEQEFAKAISLDPKNPTPHQFLAGLLEKKGDYQGAEQQLEAAVNVAPKDIRARAALASLYVRGQNNAKAEQTLIQAVDDMPEDQDASALLAEYYAKTGQMDRAAAEFQSLNSKYPKSFAIKLTLARIFFDKKDYADSTTLANQLTKIDAGNPDVQTLNATLLLNTGKTDDALALLKKSVKDYPNNLAPQLLLGKVAASKGDLATAESAYRAADKINPGNIEALNGLAEVASQQRPPDFPDVGMLSQTAAELIQTHPEYPGGYLWRGIAEASRQEFTAAENDLQKVIKDSPDNSLAYLELGQVRFAQGHIPEGQALLETALQKNPNSARALQLLAAYDLKAKQPAKALARVQQQIAKSPNNASFYVQLAALQLMTKDPKGALDSSRKAMQLNPADPDAAKMFVQTEIELGDTDSAASVWGNWVASHPSDPNAIAIMGTLEAAKGDDDKAEDDYKKALQLDPNNAIAANNLAYMMVERGDNVDVALTLAQTARRVSPDSPQTADTLAWVFYHKEDYFAARDLLQEALKTFPNDPEMNLHLGMTLAKLNQKDAAKAQLKKTISIAGNTKAGKDAADELQKLQ